MKNRKTQGFTLYEILIVVVIVGILAAIAVPALNLSKSTATSTQIQANLRSLNTIASQMRSAGYTNAGSTGSDKEAALAFYKARGFFQTQPEPDFSKLVFENGVWREGP